jgi:hypothetical protein
MMKLLRVLDRVTGYIYVPRSSSTHQANTLSLFSSALSMDAGEADIDEIQERWVDMKEEYDEVETQGWRREGEARAVAARKSASDAAEN